MSLRRDSSSQNPFRITYPADINQMSYRYAHPLGASTNVAAAYTREHQMWNCSYLLSPLLLGDAKTEELHKSEAGMDRSGGHRTRVFYVGLGSRFMEDELCHHIIRRYM
jgi:hypothetical protein